MSKDAVVRARMENTLKQEVESILLKLGLNVTDAINLYFQQIKLHNGLPFELKIPNAETKEAIEKAQKDIDVIHCKNTDELFKELDI